MNGPGSFDNLFKNVNYTDKQDRKRHKGKIKQNIKINL